MTTQHEDFWDPVEEAMPHRTSKRWSEGHRRPQQTNPQVGTCSKCGIPIHERMHYSCRESDCPLFPQTRVLTLV